jgi:chemotaxis protein MotB
MQEFEKDPTQPTAPSRAWLVIFTDLVSLLLTFFVMMFAMSNVKVDQWESMTDALSLSLNPTRVQSESRPTAEFNVSSVFSKRAINLDYLAGVFEKAIAADANLSGAQVVRLEDRLIVALPGALLFDPGRAELAERAGQALFSLSGVLRNIDNRLSVNGHSDPSPPAGDAYVSNWELSLARAVNVANALRRAGYTEEITARGYAHGHYFELPAGLPESERRALGRRIDIVILPTVGGA